METARHVSVPAQIRSCGGVMISRPRFIAATGGVVLAGRAFAQSKRSWHIGYLAPGMPDDETLLKAFLDGLRELLPNFLDKRCPALCHSIQVMIHLF